MSSHSRERRVVRSFETQSLDDLWDDEKAVGFCGRISHRLLMVQRGTDFIRPGDVDERKSVSSGFDAGDIYFIQLLDIAKDLTQLGAIFPGFFGS